VEGAELEEGRGVALKALGTMRLDPQLRDLMARQVSAQRSKEGLMDSLRSFAAFLQSQPVESPLGPVTARLRRLAVRRADEIEEGHPLISVDEALYLFFGNAPLRGLVRAAWSRAATLRPDAVYLRTVKDLFVTHYRSLATVQKRLDARQFLPIHQSIIVNILKIAEIDDAGKSKHVAVIVAEGPREWLTVSRRSLPTLRQELGIPLRRRH
jgi:hypothetical protein